MWFKSTKKEEKGLFTENWLNEWYNSINSSKEFKQKGKTWNAPLILKFDPLPNHFQENEATGIYLNLKYGECIELRYSNFKDEDSSDVILTADEKTWIQLMVKRADPTSMIMNNQLSLEKGSLILLSTQSKAARVLLKTAPTSNFESEQLKENIKLKVRTNFSATSKGLNMNCVPMQLYQKAMAEGSWNPSDIDFSEDRKDWKVLDKAKKKVIAHFLSLLIAGEEASGTDHLPLAQIISSEGRLEEQMYTTTLLLEESKHLNFYTRYAKDVMGNFEGFEKFHGPHFKSFYYRKLPQITWDLEYDSSPLAQLKASAILNAILKDILTKTSYLSLNSYLKELEIMPGIQEGLLKIETDESRHETFARYFIDRVLSENKDLREPLEKILQTLLIDATNVIQEIYRFYDDKNHFGIRKEFMLNRAIKEHQTTLIKLGLQF